MEPEQNISGISENLSDSIAEQKIVEKKPQGKLYGLRIAISVSDSEELEQLGLSKQHLKDISIEIARYLIVNGATMLYGGDLREGGFTGLFSELSYQYKYLSDKERRFINYFPFPTSYSLSENDIANFKKNQVEAMIIDIPKHLEKINSVKEYEPFKNIEDRYILAECYADMRKKMATESNARIILGGRQKGFSGYFPGIVEEAFYSLKEDKAVYLLGGFGGATKSIIDIILGKKPIQLTNDFQFDTNFLRDFRIFISEEKGIKMDYNLLCNFFNEYSVESLSKKNGLTADENRTLFESTNIHELVFLIIKGLQNISLK